MENFKFQINSILSNDCPYAVKEVSIDVNKSNTKYDVIPVDNFNLKTK